jgi:hypothetical protein
MRQAGEREHGEQPVRERSRGEHRVTGRPVGRRRHPLPCSCFDPDRVWRTGTSWSRRGRAGTAASGAPSARPRRSRVVLDGQSAGLPLGFRKIADLGAGKRRWGLRHGGWGCAGGRAPVRVGLRRGVTAGDGGNVQRASGGL